MHPRAALCNACRKVEGHPHAEGQEVEGKPLLAMNGAMVDVEASSHGNGPAPTTPAGHAGAEPGKPSYAWTTSAFYRCLMLDEEALLACRDALRAAVEFGTILAWFYVADRTSIIAPGAKVRLLVAPKLCGGHYGAEQQCEQSCAGLRQPDWGSGLRLSGCGPLLLPLLPTASHLEHHTAHHFCNQVLGFAGMAGALHLPRRFPAYPLCNRLHDTLPPLRAT